MTKSFIESLPNKTPEDHTNKIAITVKISKEEDYLLSLVLANKPGYTKDELIYLLLKQYVFDDESLKVQQYVKPTFNNCYIVNTNKKHYKKGADFMLSKGCAATFNTERHLEKMYKIKKGDLVFLYSSGDGIIAYGFASGEVINTIQDNNTLNYQELSNFKKLDIPLKPKDINTILGRQVSFLHTLFNINDGDKILNVLNTVLK